jgi:shikimate dehydrogenase
MKRYGLIGYPLSHSFSKNYFEQKFLAEDIQDCSYDLFPLKNIEELPLLIESTKGLQGLNVTIPYKEQVLRFVTVLSDAVESIGACNCIKIQDGILTAFNTDVLGFEQSLKPLLRPEYKKALILGTGGAAKAVAWVLGNLGIEYSYVSRNPGEQRFISYEMLHLELVREHKLIVNTTPLGMQPNIHQKPSLPYAGITPYHLCYDLIYNPAKTAFLLAAEAQGATIKNGLEMLTIQAEESWKLWNTNL